MKNKFLAFLRERLLPFLKHTFLHNWGAKLLSFVFAIVLWNYAVLTLETTRSVTIQDAPLTVTNGALLRQRGLSLSQSVQDVAGSVRVVIATPLSGAASVSRDQVTVTCDLSSINAAGVHTVNLVGRTIHGQVQEVSPSRITLEVEAMGTRELPIHITCTGNTIKDSFAGDPESSAATVTLTGPSALLATVKEAQVTVPLNSASQDIENSYPVRLLGEEGTEITSTLITASLEEVIVKVPVIHRREFPILTDSCLVGADRLREGYKIASIEVYPKTLQVEGSAKAIRTLEEAGGLTLSQIDLTDASSDIRSYPSVFLPNGASLTQPQSILVLINIEREMKTVVISDVPVELRNVTADLKGILSSPTVTLTLTGPTDLVDRIPEGHIEVYVDAQNRSAGTFIAPVHVLIDSRYEAQVTPSQTDLTVTLQPIEPME